MAWSGDILNDKLYFPEFATFEFTIPDAGAVIFIDNGCIPNKAANPVGAEMLMDWYYDPTTRRCSPSGTRTSARSRRAGRSCRRTPRRPRAPTRRSCRRSRAAPTCSRPPSSQTKLHNYRVLEGDEVQTWNDHLQPDLPDVAAPERRPKRSRAPYGLGDAGPAVAARAVRHPDDRDGEPVAADGEQPRGVPPDVPVRELHRRAVAERGVPRPLDPQRGDRDGHRAPARVPRRLLDRVLRRAASSPCSCSCCCCRSSSRS